MSDIVQRLRAMSGSIVPNTCTEAADEIERLRGLFNGALVTIGNMTDEAMKLRTERDKARQEICIRECDTLGAVFGGSPATPQDYAKERGWDCFKENTNGS